MFICSLVLTLVAVPASYHVPVGERVLEIAALEREYLSLQVGQAFLQKVLSLINAHSYENPRKQALESGADLPLVHSFSLAARRVRLSCRAGWHWPFLPNGTEKTRGVSKFKNSNNTAYRGLNF